jgi:hypothetical protein
MVLCLLNKYEGASPFITPPPAKRGGVLFNLWRCDEILILPMNKNLNQLYYFIHRLFD